MPTRPGGARCPRSQACGRDARAPRWGRMPALPMRTRRSRSQVGQDARAPSTRARRPRSQAGQDARAPGMRARRPRSQGGMPASLACGRDARAPRWGRMPASLACGRDARAPRAGCPRSQVGTMPAHPGGAGCARSQAGQGRERLQRVRNMVFESLFRSRPRRQALPRRVEGVWSLKK